MGCGKSNFEKVENSFVLATNFRREQAYMDSGLWDLTQIMKLLMLTSSMEKVATTIIRHEDGPDLCKIVFFEKELRFVNTRGDLVGLMTLGVRCPAAHGNDSTFDWPYVYFYHTRPYGCAVQDNAFHMDANNTPIFVWARLHKTSMRCKKRCFQVSVADGALNTTSLNSEVFLGPVIDLTCLSDSTMVFTKHGAGAACARKAADSNYQIAIAPCIDPVLILCSILAVDMFKRD